MPRTPTVPARALALALVALLVGALVALASPASAADDDPSDDPSGGTLTWSLVPSDEAGTPDGRQSFREELDPGASVTEHAVLTNYSSQAVTFTITASDGVIAEDGSFDILQDAEQPTDSGAWVAVQDSVTVDPESAVLIPFTITVPADAVPGDHPAGLTAGVATTSTAEGGPGVGFSARVGVRLHLRVTGEVTAALAVPDVDVRYAYSWNPFAAGRLEITPTVENDGNVRVASTGRVETEGPFGVAGTTTSVAPREVLPRSSYETTTTVSAWPLVRVTTTVSVTPSAVGTDDLGDAALAAASVTTTTWVVPWPQLALLALVVLLVWFALRTRTRRRARLAALLAEARQEGAASAAMTPAPDTPDHP